MKPHLHIGHAFAGLFVLCALLATLTAPARSPLPLAGPAPLLALPPAPELPQPIAPDSVAGILAANPACRELANGCQICVRGTDNQPQCSTPGIACAPSGWQCMLPAAGKVPTRN